MFIRNGKTWKLNLKTEEYKEICPFDNAELKRIYDYTNYTGSFTEYPEDWLPVGFKKANVDSIVLLECKTCQKRFMMWANFDDVEFHEVKIIPDNSYNEIRENEAGKTEQTSPVISESDLENDHNNQNDHDCDCGGKCDNHECGNNKMNPNTRFNRPDFYG